MSAADVIWTLAVGVAVLAGVTAVAVTVLIAVATPKGRPAAVLVWTCRIGWVLVLAFFIGLIVLREGW